MSTSTAQKQPCAICSKAAGMFTCQGCSKNLCARHVAEHRQELGTQIEEITLEHDRFRQTLNEQMQKLELHPLMKQIADWEQQSIEKIHQSAHNARQQLHQTIGKQSTELTEKLNKIAVELRKAQEDDDFFETDLKQWIERLNELKNNLTQPANIKIQQNNDNTIVIVSLNELFGQSFNGIEIIDNGQAIIRRNSNGHLEARGRGEYSSGQHRFRFQIEVYNSSKWIFIGIISKDTSMQSNSYGSSSSYGWAGGSQVYLGGVQQGGYKNFKDDIEQNDIMELFCDCDKRIIRLTNERTKSVHELPIDINKCPFPWQIHVNLHYQNDCVRILAS